MNAPMMNPISNMVGKSMGNNPMMAMMQMLRSGGNPMPILQNMAKTNPQVAQALSIVQGKSPEQLKTIATNMCRERGTTVEEIANQMGLQFPK